MNKPLVISQPSNEITFFDLDRDNEMEVAIEKDHDFCTIYLDIDEMIDLRDHLKYLINKYNLKGEIK